MNSVTQIHAIVDRESLVTVPEMPMLQARLAKDGSDDDIKLAFSDEAMKRANVVDRTARLKSLVRKGIQAEQGVVVTDNDDFIFDGNELQSSTKIIAVRIGSQRITIHR